MKRVSTGVLISCKSFNPNNNFERLFEKRNRNLRLCLAKNGI